MANFENVSTPWGKSHGGQLLAPGIKQYHTAGHGGIKVMKKLNDKIPAGFRYAKGWYEEDCVALIVYYYYYDAIEAHMRAHGMQGYNVSADEYFSKFTREWFKGELERWYIPESIHYFGTVYPADVLEKEGLDEIRERIAHIRRKDTIRLPRKGDIIIFDQPIRFRNLKQYAKFIYRRGNIFECVENGGLYSIHSWRERLYRIEHGSNAA